MRSLVDRFKHLVFVESFDYTNPEATIASSTSRQVKEYLLGLAQKDNQPHDRLAYARPRTG